MSFNYFTGFLIAQEIYATCFFLWDHIHLYNYFGGFAASYLCLHFCICLVNNRVVLWPVRSCTLLNVSRLLLTLPNSLYSGLECSVHWTLFTSITVSCLTKSKLQTLQARATDRRMNLSFTVHQTAGLLCVFPVCLLCKSARTLLRFLLSKMLCPCLGHRAYAVFWDFLPHSSCMWLLLQTHSTGCYSTWNYRQVKLF